MAWIAQNGQKCLILIVVPQVRTKMREKGKREKNHENRQVKRKHTNIYPMYIYTPSDLQTYKNADTYIHILTLRVIQGR